MSASNYTYHLKGLAEVLEARSGDLVTYDIAAQLEVWVNSHAGGIEVTFYNTLTDKFIEEKTYKHEKWALRGLRAKMAKLGFPVAMTETEERVRVVEPASSSQEENENAQSGAASYSSIWEKVPVYFVLRTIRTRGDAEVVGEVRELQEGGFESKVIFDGRTGTQEFDTEWQAKNHVVTSAAHLLDWAA